MIQQFRVASVVVSRYQATGIKIELIYRVATDCYDNRGKLCGNVVHQPGFGQEF